MEKILFYADTHFNIYREFSDGDVSRLDRLLEVQQAIISYAIDSGIHNLVFLGDWFHNRSQLNVMVLQKTLELMYKTLNMDLQFYFLVGNHDQYDSRGVFHSLYPFKLTGVVLDNPGYVKIGERLVGFVPYHSNREWLLQSVESLVDHADMDMLCLHQGVIEAEFSNGVRAGDELFLSVKDLPSHLPIVAGHIHKPQVLGNMLYVGSPLQHNFGDTGDRKGWYVLDDTGEFEFVENNFSPRFYKLEMRNGKLSFPKECTVDDYYWITTDGDVEEVRKAFPGAKYLRVDTFPKEVQSNERSFEKDKTFEQMIDEYVEGTIADDEVHDEVKRYGKDVLKRVVLL